MKAMICEMCGGRDFIKQDGFWVCQFCGCKYSTEEERQLFEITCKADVGGISACEQLLERGNTYLKLADYKAAQDTFKEFINTYPHKRIGYEKYFTAISENFAKYFVYNLADSHTKAEINNIIEKLKKIDDERDTYDAKNFLKKIEDYLNWIDLKEQKEQKENILNRLPQDSLFLSERIDTEKLLQKRSLIVIIVFSVIGFFHLCLKSSWTVYIFLVVGFFIICSAMSKRDVKNMSQRLDEICTAKIKLEKEIEDLNNKINKIKINW